MKLGIGALAAGNPTGLGRLARGYLLALAWACPDWELHVFLRNKADAQRLAEECDQASLPLLDQLIPYFPATPISSRVFLEEYEIPQRMSRLSLDAWLGLDFTLPRLPVATREAVVLPDLLPFTQPRTLSWRARLLYRNAIRRALQRQARIICISQCTLQKLQRIFPAGVRNTSVIYPPLSPRFKEMASKLEIHDTPVQVLGSHNSASGLGSYLLAVGITGQRKNTSLLVDIHREIVLQGDYKGALVLVGGAGHFHNAPLRSDFAMQAIGSLMDQGSRAAMVYDLGRVKDQELALLFRNADLYVNLSSEEGFGYPVLEALSLGTPALVTAASSMTEISDLGIVETELERESCRRKLLETLSQLAELRLAARSFDPARFDLAVIGAQLRGELEDGK